VSGRKNARVDLHHRRLRRISEARDTDGNSRPLSATKDASKPTAEVKHAATGAGSGAKIGPAESLLRERVAARNQKSRSRTPVTCPPTKQQLGFGSFSRGRTPKKSTARSTTPSSSTPSPKLKAESKQAQIDPLHPSPLRSSKPSPRALTKTESRSRSKKPSVNSTPVSLPKSTPSGGAHGGAAFVNASPVTPKAKEHSSGQIAPTASGDCRAGAAPPIGRVALRLAEKAAVDVVADQETY